MAAPTETYEANDGSAPNGGAIVAALGRVTHLRRGPKPSVAMARRVEANRRDRVARETEQAGTHKATFEELSQTVARLALRSENLRDRYGDEKAPGPDGEQHKPIESRLEIMQPMSRRGHHLYRLSRLRPLRWVAPRNTKDLDEYLYNVKSEPNAPPDPNPVQYRSRRTGSAWVLKAHQGFATDPKDNSGRVPLTPQRYRPNAVIIEVPERGQEHFRSWLGGAEPYDKEHPHATADTPWKIATGEDGEGTTFHRRGFKGLSTGFHGSVALERITSVGYPGDADMQTSAVENYIGQLAEIEDTVLNRIAEENGVTQQQMNEYAASRPIPAGAEPTSPLSVPRPSV